MHMRRCVQAQRRPALSAARVPSRDGPPAQHARAQHTPLQAFPSDAGGGVSARQSAMGQQDLV